MPCVGQEGSDTVALVKAFIPDKWRAGSATSAPVCAATSMNFTAVCEEDADFEAIPEPISQVGRARTWICFILLEHNAADNIWRHLPVGGALSEPATLLSCKFG